MDQAFKQGDKVSWSTPQGKTVGKVVKKLTSRTEVKGHTVAASKENPQYLVESEKEIKMCYKKLSDGEILGMVFCLI